MASGLVMGIGSAVGGVASAAAAGSAARAQKSAANRQLDIQEKVYGETVNRLAPWVQGGMTADQAAGSMLGLGAAPMIGATMPGIETITTPGVTTPGPNGLAIGGHTTDPTTSYKVGDKTFATMAEAQAYATQSQTGGTPWQWQASPSYQFNLSQGLGAIEAGRAAKGGLYSGAAMKAAQDYGSGMASNEFWNVYNALGGRSSAGMSAAAGQGQAGANYATGASNALANYGNASAAGAVGVGNAITGGVNNAMSSWGYLQGLNALKGAKS